MSLFTPPPELIRPAIRTARQRRAFSAANLIVTKFLHEEERAVRSDMFGFISNVLFRASDETSQEHFVVADLNTEIPHEQQIDATAQRLLTQLSAVAGPYANRSDPTLVSFGPSTSDDASTESIMTTYPIFAGDRLLEIFRSQPQTQGEGYLVQYSAQL